MRAGSIPGDRIDNPDGCVPAPKIGVAQTDRIERSYDKHSRSDGRAANRSKCETDYGRSAHPGANLISSNPNMLLL